MRKSGARQKSRALRFAGESHIAGPVRTNVADRAGIGNLQYSPGHSALLA
jgi:hypothetical protein